MLNTLCNYFIQKEIQFVNWIVFHFKKEPMKSEATTRIKDALEYQKRQQKRRNGFTPPYPMPPAPEPPKEKQ